MSLGAKCFNCGKGIMVGKQHKHHPGVAGGRWKKRAPKTQKIFKPNLHYTRVKVDGNMKRVRLCTKCLRRVKEALKPKKISVSVESASTQTPVAAV